MKKLANKRVSPHPSEPSSVSANSSKTPHPAPSERELRVIELLAQGLSSQEIAIRMNISEHTVSTHRKMLIRKTGSRNTVDLVALSIRKEWI